jgi:hypothetical protein
MTFAILLLANVQQATGQAMRMPGMENSVGFMSSGTSIEPASLDESNPMVHSTVENWTLILHGVAFISNIQQSGPRGHDKTFSTNWFMPMLTRDFGRQRLSFRTMISLEPWTVTQRRYPELFQTGETAYGIPIVDGQHPHDLIMELTGRYDLQLTDKSSFFLYGGPVGEPALGPPAYPHRASASENPLAVLGHHQEDSTHVSDAVITAGLVDRRLQIEASTFHGREPNENRWNIDTGAPDSYSGRLTVAANDNLVGQFSMGRINQREALEPNLDTIRTTASLEHHLPFSRGQISTSLIWGRNKDLTHPGRRIFNSYTFESTINFRIRDWLWTRIENVDRDQTLLVGEVPAARNVEETPIGKIQAYTFGYEHDIPSPRSLNLGLGGQFTTYGMTPQIANVYGNHPASVVVFLRVRPAGNMAQHMRMMHNH